MVIDGNDIHVYLYGLCIGTCILGDDCLTVDDVNAVATLDVEELLFLGAEPVLIALEVDAERSGE